MFQIPNLILKLIDIIRWYDLTFKQIVNFDDEKLKS